MTPPAPWDKQTGWVEMEVRQSPGVKRGDCEEVWRKPRKIIE